MEENLILYYIEDKDIEVNEVEVLSINKEDLEEINKFRLGKVLISRFYGREDIYSKVDLAVVESKIQDLLYGLLNLSDIDEILKKVNQAKEYNEKKFKIAREEIFSKKIGRRLYVLRDIIDSIVIDSLGVK